MMKRMVVGPEIARLLRSHEAEGENNEENSLRHEDTNSHEKRFRENISSLKSIFNEVGNPFEEEDILLHINSRQILSIHIPTFEGWTSLWRKVPTVV